MKICHGQPGHFPRIVLKMDSIFSNGYKYNDFDYSAWLFYDSLQYTENLKNEYRNDLSYVLGKSVMLAIVGDKYYNENFPQRCGVIKITINNKISNKIMRIFIRVSYDMTWNSQIELVNLFGISEGYFYYDMYIDHDKKKSNVAVESPFLSLNDRENLNNRGTIYLDLSSYMYFRMSLIEIFKNLSQNPCSNEKTR